MNRIPNMRVEVSGNSSTAILAAGGCVSYLATGSTRTVYAMGKPDHLYNMMDLAGVTVIGKPEMVPRYTN